MFFVFEVEVLGGFKAWFQYSFWTFESWSPPALLRIPLNALGRLLFIGVWGWVSDTWRSLIGDTWRSLIGDTCHSLIGPPMSSLTRARPLVSSLTRTGLLMSSLTRVEVLVSSLTRTEV